MLILIVALANGLSAQTSYYGNKYNITATFDTTKFVISRGKVISKTLKIVNLGTNTMKFSLNLTHPAEWRSLNPREREYNLAGGDSIFIPVRIVPMGRIRGNTSYLIYAYVVNTVAVPVASAYFLATRRKIVSWELNVDPGEKMYFKNGEREVNFSLNVMNTGNEETDLILELRNMRKDRLLLTDTNDRVIRESETFTVKELEERTFYYKIKSTNSIRNYQRVDVENFKPDKGMEYQKFGLFAISRESALTGKGEMVKGKRIDFIRLPNYEKANLHARSSVPLIMHANLGNVVGRGQPVLSINLQGNTTLKNNALLLYNSFNSFSSYIGSARFLTRGSYYLGYFDEKFNISTNSSPGAKSLSGYYRINRRQSITGSYIRGPSYFGKSNRTGFSLGYNYAGAKFSQNASFGRFTSTTTGLSINTASYSVSSSISQGHTVGLTFGLGNNVSVDPNNSFNKTGFQVGVGYGGSFLQNKLSSSISASIFSSNFNVYGTGNTFALNHASRYRMSNNWSLTLSNRYQDNRNIQQVFVAPNNKYIIFTNQATFGRQIGEQAFTSEVFYNITDLNTILSHSRGVGIGLSRFTIEDNKLVSMNIRGGYNRNFTDPNPKDIFFAQFFTLFRYRVWSGNIRYNYGSLAPLSQVLVRGLFPQTVGASVSNQHAFANPHFVLENIITYSYFNVSNRQSIGFNPDLYYFTNSGWRIRLTTGFFFSTSTRSNLLFASPNTDENGDPNRITSTSFNLNLGVRKEFGIPIPWAETEFPTVRFMTFIDHDGNGQKGQGEVALENVVIRFGKWELLTNLDGEAHVENVAADSVYAFSVFSLVDLKGYFPKIDNEFLLIHDSLMMIPFVKGIKVYGNVYLDREKIAPGAADKLDLSRIKIQANDGNSESIYTLTNSDGSFQFYLPYGKYKISVDDKILGDNFRILQNNIDVDLGDMSDGMFISFYIVERRRKINLKKFNGNGKVIKGSRRTVQPDSPDNGTVPDGSGDQGQDPGGDGQQDGGTAPPDGAGIEGGGPGGTEQPGAAPADTASNGATDIPPTEGAGADVSLRDQSESVALELENKSITWEETEYYIVVRAFSQEDAARDFGNSQEQADNILIIRSKDNLQYLAIYAYRTEAEATADLASRKSLAPAAWITKKGE